MTTKKSYNRFFIIFQEEDKGYGVAIDKQPTGYAKIEVKNGKCKITVYAQNLKKEKGPFFFHMLDTTKTPVLLLNLGEVKIDEAGKGETWWEYNEENIKDSKCSVDKFNMALIIVPGESIIAPLAGYVGKDKIDWKEKVVKENKHQGDEGESSEDSSRGTEEEVVIEELDEEGLKFKEYEDEIRGEGELTRTIPEEELVETPLDDVNMNNDNPKSFKDTDGLRHDNSKSFEETDILRPDNAEALEDTDIDRYRHDSHKSHKDHEDKHKEYKSHASIFHQMLANFDEVKDIFEEDEDEGSRWWKIPYNCSFPLMENKYYPFLCTIYHLKMTYPNIDYIKYFYKKGYYYFGLKYDKDKEVKHIMYGIEGANTMKEQPYMGMTGFGKWMKLPGENNGMWVMFYNPRTGNIMVEKNE